jgi:Flp pilus assembly protein TadG
MRRQKMKRTDRGATMVEMSIASGVVFLALFAVIEFGRLLFIHNGLTDATRRAARFAAIHSSSNTNDVQNIAVYGVTNPPAGAKPVVDGLTPGQVSVTYNNFGIKQGTVTVMIQGYTFKLNIPLVGRTLQLSDYRTTLTGEAAGYNPPDMP